MGRSTAILAGFSSALLTAAASLGGILFPMYARETPSIAAQGIGQDWVDLTVVTPFLVLSSVCAARGSSRALLLLGGGLAYTAYTYAVYAFGVHFNALFLVYCAALGVSIFGLAAVLREEFSPPPVEQGQFRLAGWTQIGIAAAFGFLWLSDIVPAIATGGAPKAVVDDNLVTNPVHVLDLSIVLPALVISGLQTLRHRPLGFLLSPILLTLSLLMSVAIGGMVIAVRLQGLPTDVAVAGAFLIVALLCGWILSAILRRGIMAA